MPLSNSSAEKHMGQTYSWTKRKKRLNVLRLCPSSLVPFLLIICRMTLKPCTFHIKKEHLNILEKKWDFTMLLKFYSFWRCCNMVKRCNILYIKKLIKIKMWIFPIVKYMYIIHLYLIILRRQKSYLEIKLS